MINNNIIYYYRHNISGSGGFLLFLHLTGWLQQHAPPQQLGQDFRPSHSEDGGHRWNGDFTVARIRQQIVQKRHAEAPTARRISSWEPCRRERVATSGGRKRTHHRQDWLCCVCWIHACQRKLVLPRPKEVVGKIY